MHRAQTLYIISKAIPRTNKWTTLTLAVMASLLLIVPPALGQDPRNGTNQGGKSATGHPYLFIGDTADPDMPIVEPGHKITHRSASQGFKFAFNRPGLFQGWDKAWIDGIASYSGTALYQSDSLVADEFGNAYVKGSTDPSYVLGMRYTFKQFHFRSFKRSILSFMKNFHNTCLGERSSVSLYFDAPKL
jgi:hypothetical protein